MKNIGFMIGRFMPLHNGHIELINATTYIDFNCFL